ncbi:cell division protein FtsQ/DivIB [Enterococcus faecium]|uniref:cell division protein FtsQ/DivIB n=1 Tax=Enterococcus faecium TaxID=1352 RepID=UPI00319E41B7
MSKKKEPKKLSHPSSDENNLTPWQKANRKYLAEQGMKNQEPKKEDTPLDTPLSDSEEEKTVQGEQQETSQSESQSEKKIEFFEEIKQKKNGGPYNGSFLNRLPNLKSQRHKVLFRRLALIITVLGIPLIFLIYYVSPYSKLQAVAVSGNKVVNSQEIISDTKLSLGENVWGQYFDRSTYIERLKKAQPRIEKAAIHFKGINEFDLDVTEYKEIALIAKDNQYYPVIENGTVLDEKVANPTKNLPILEEFKDSAKIKELTKQYNQLSSELQKAISEIKYTPRASNKNLIQLNMNDGNQVIVNINNLANQMKYYSQVAKDMDEKGVIDMEIGIYSYPYSSTQETAESDQTEETTGSEENADQTNGSSEEAETQAADTPESSDINGSSDSNNSSETSQIEDNPSTTPSSLNEN